MGSNLNVLTIGKNYFWRSEWLYAKLSVISESSMKTFFLPNHKMPYRIICIEKWTEIHFHMVEMIDIQILNQLLKRIFMHYKKTMNMRWDPIFRDVLI